MPSWLRKICTKLVWAAKQLNRIVRAVEPVVIIIAIIAFSIELGDRQEERTVRAWQLLTTRAPGNSGKIEALEYLNSESHWFFRSWWPFSKERIRLHGIDLTPPALVEQWKDKPKQDQTVSSEDCPQFTYLSHAQLPNAILGVATLVCVNLYDANLRGADLYRADLNGADLHRANLNGADLRRANLNGADLNGANLNGANLRGANLNGANLNGANLNGANLNGANLNGANLRRATNLTAEQVQSAINWRDAILPDDLNYLKRSPDPPA